MKEDSPPRNPELLLGAAAQLIIGCAERAKAIGGGGIGAVHCSTESRVSWTANGNEADVPDPLCLGGLCAVRANKITWKRTCNANENVAAGHSKH